MTLKSTILLGFLLQFCVLYVFAQQLPQTTAEATKIMQLLPPDSLKLDSVRQVQQLKHWMDSLGSLDLSHEQYLKKLDSLQKYATISPFMKFTNTLNNTQTAFRSYEDSIGNRLTEKLQYDPFGDAKEKIEAFNTQVKKVEDSIQTKINRRIEKWTKGTSQADDIKEETTKIKEKINVDGIQEPLNENIKDKINLQSQGVKETLTKHVDPLRQEIEEIAPLKPLEGKIDGIKQVTRESISELKENESLQLFQEHKQKLKDLGSKMQAQQQAVTDKLAAAKELPKTVEQKVENLEAVKAFKSKKGELTPYQEEIQNWKEEKHAKQQITNKVKEQAVNHFTKQAESLEKTQKKLAKLKKKYENVQNIKNLPKRPENPLKGKPLKKRLILGATLQVHKGQPLGIDVSPQLGYKFTKNLSAGLGGSYRTAINDEERYLLTRELEVYGYRAWTKMKIWKGFFGYGEYENLRHGKKNHEPKQVNTWVSGAHLGIGRSHKFLGRIEGHMLLMYNWLHKGVSPYRSAWNIRLGFVIGERNKLRKIHKEKLKQQQYD
ncbi:hypothetical protein QQ008_16980 [Fulvivirgaceae bacterium BMA10]|uniref:Uncharacterized protein n=1 Tax=Splendidivirga corallicola TaxID=3051826 RepID=A0ABT8KQR8_9BACT|nr:hypothetical protein [Fulvivirgaceae bacterium BMA10]